MPGSALSIVSAKDDSSLVCDTPNLIITTVVVILIMSAKERTNKMTTAIDIDTNENISIKPIAIYQSDAFDVLLLADANTGKGIWRGFDYQWYTDPEDGDLDHDADKIEDVYGADEEEWEAAANAKLAEYGFKLGDFDEKAGDRYTLVEA